MWSVNLFNPRLSSRGIINLAISVVTIYINLNNLFPTLFHSESTQCNFSTEFVELGSMTKILSHDIFPKLSTVFFPHA